MKVKKVRNRGILFTFKDLDIPTNIYTIQGGRYIYIIDTYLGPDIMKSVNQYIGDTFGNKPIIVVNTHSHWDHVWGNSLYSSSFIVAHKKCKKHMQQYGLQELEEFGKYRKGEVIITYPNLTFTDKIFFEEDDVLIYHTPGHTDDGISILDMEDKILFAGDNLERPIPYLMSKDLNQYMSTLESYLKIDADIIIGGHTDCEDKDLVRDNLDYVKKVIFGETIEIKSKEFEEHHKANLAWLNQYEE